MAAKPTLLYLTDLYYPAKGRNYYEEDLYLTSRLKDHFHVLIGNPQQALSFLKAADQIVFRNTGPVYYYQDYFNEFMEAIQKEGIPTFNSFDGKADREGKQYLVDLYAENYAVIPTIESISSLNLIPQVDQYVIKLKNGADSIGMEIVNRRELEAISIKDRLIQPLIDFDYEVSFFFINKEFQYALFAPDRARRWEMKVYQASDKDIRFAQNFISWNTMTRGIQRVDACRLPDGRLLLVELEDLNPFLSLDKLNAEAKEAFIRNFIDGLKHT